MAVLKGQPRSFESVHRPAQTKCRLSTNSTHVCGELTFSVNTLVTKLECVSQVIRSVSKEPTPRE